MGDDVTWQVLAAILTISGLVLSALVWKRRGAASGIRGVAWSLLPLAALLTGTLRLLREIGVAVTTWAASLVLSPFVWFGVGLAAASASLFVVSSMMRRRGVGRRSGVRSEATEAELSSAPRGAGEPGGPRTGDDDLADVEAILKKHGIS